MSKKDGKGAGVENLIIHDEEVNNVRVSRVSVKNLATVIDKIEDDDYILRTAFLSPNGQVTLIFKKKPA